MNIFLLLTALFSAPAVAEHDTSAGVTGLDVWGAGQELHLLIGRRTGKTVALEHLRSNDSGGTWSAAAPVGAGQARPYRAEAGDIQLAGSGGDLLAVWTSTGPGPMGSGPLAAALSQDNGRTWRPAAAPGSRGQGHGRRFADLAAGSGVWHAVWLDRLENSQLRYSRWDGRADAWEAERTLDDEVCECCWNTAAVSAAGVAAFYRDKSPRDMAFTASSDGGKSWASPARPGDFNWRFNGCPHVGGALAAAGSTWHVLAWTGLGGREGLYHMSVEGSRWSAARRLGGMEARFSDLAAGPDGRLAAVWSEPEKGLQAVFQSLSSDDGKTWTKPARLSPEGKACSHPRIVAAGGGFRVFWIEKRPEGRSWSSAAL